MSNSQNDLIREQREENKPMEHAKLPYSADESTSLGIKSTAISDDYGDTIFHMNVFKEEKETADFIVKACNSHDELVEACKLALKYFVEYDGIDVLKLATLTLKLTQAINNAERNV